MYINLKNFLNEKNLKIKGVVHIGAHKGEELKVYRSLKIKNIILYEANDKLIKNLRIKKFFYKFFYKTNIEIINKAVSESLNCIDLNITSNSQSSSILDLKDHKKLYPQIKKIETKKVQSTTLNEDFSTQFNICHYNMLNMDIEGAELLVLKGSSSILPLLDLIYTEINFAEMYKDCAMADELDKFLSEYGFYRAITKTPESDLWGDAIYIKK